MPTKDSIPPIGFPDPSLAVLYQDVLRYIQYRLKSFAHGQLKLFCTQHSFSYPSVVNLKNGTLPRKEHLLLQRILAALSFETTAILNPKATNPEEHLQFLFPGQEELKKFREQLAYIDSTSPPPSQ